ncbi:MAG: hypothetical protein WCY26_04950 [Thiohalobacteraceae bacterium]|nr:hypothetical protein [Gammaproteobacteria bacterium]
MTTRTAAATRLPLAAIIGLCAGCAGIGTGDHHAELPHLSPGHDLVLAWVPRERAQTGAVAEAAAHIALAKAKRAAEAELCGGTWLFSGTLEQDSRAVLAVAPESLGGFTGWQVRIRWAPHVAECGVSPQRYALAVSEHLPEWMMTQSSQPLALFHRGTALYHQDAPPYSAIALHGAD